MLEVFGIIFLYRQLKSMLLKKGRGTGLAVLGPVFWIVGEIGGMVVGFVVKAMNESDGSGVVYMLAIGGAITGAMLAFFIVFIMPAINLGCPFCRNPLPTNIDRNYCRLSCPTCKEEIKVMNGVVVSQ